MESSHETQAQLLDELEKLRQRIAELEALEASRRRAEEILEERNRELAALDSVARVLSTSVNIEEVLHTALRCTLEVMAVPTGGVYLPDERSGLLVLAAKEGMSEEYARAVARIRPGKNISGRVFETGETAVAADMPKDPRLASGVKRAADREKMKSVVSVPLKSKGRILGALELASRAYWDLSASELRLLEGIASQIGVAIENAQLFQRVKELSITDELTGLYNRRHFYEVVEIELYRAQRYGQSLSLAIIDLDGFKEYNDRYGHTNGDAVLRSLGRTLTSSLRRTDSAFRYGGDEFAIILPSTDGDRTKKTLDRIRSEWLEAPRAKHLVLDIPLGFSAGIAQFPQDAETADGLVFLADTALYRSKREGGYKTTAISDLGKVSTTITESATADQVYALAAMVDIEEPCAYGHSKRVAAISEMIGKAIGLSTQELVDLHAASLLHDVGKVGVPAPILTRRDSPTDLEWSLIKKHSSEGARIVSSVRELAPLVPMILHHHEWYDGSGYPDSLKGEDIPLGARIICIADAYDTMTTKREYRGVLSHEEASQELRRCSGTQFDGALVEAFCQMANRT